jgi:hypothetical protein
VSIVGGVDLYFDRRGRALTRDEWMARVLPGGRITERVAFADLGRAGQVSTIFTGLDMGFGGRPLLFETMIFGGVLDGACGRYSTEAQAKRGHRAYVRLLRAAYRRRAPLIHNGRKPR